MCDHQIQEIDINSFSCPNYTNDWKAKGFHVVLGEVCPSRNFVRVALVSRQPMRLVALPGVNMPDRVVAAVAEFKDPQGQFQKFVVASFYGPVADEAIAAQLAGQVAEVAHCFGFPWMVLGDFNVPQHDSAMADLLLRGDVFSMDECFGPISLLPPTRKNSSRRIEYGLSSRKLFPSNLNHVAGVADHLTVIYEFDCLYPPSLRRAPRRIEFQQDIPLAQLARKFQESWNELQFASLLKQGNVDQAFHQLSQVAERTLAAHATSDTVPRSASWQPGVRPSQPKAAHQAESVLLRRVRRLERRLRHLLLVPHVDTLRNKCVTGISQLAPSVFELAGYLTMSIEQLTNAAEAAVSRITQEEKLARIAAWGRQTHGNLARQSAWIKWRRQVLADIAKDPVQPDQRFAGIHPTSVIAEQQREWSARWTHDGVSTAPQVEQLLHSLPSPPLSAFPSDMQWTGSKLKQIAKEMVSKASGPDDWGAADLIVLPDGFWEALSRLWQKVYDTGSIPKMWAHARVALLPKQQMEWRPLSIASVFWRIGARHIVCQLRPWVETWLNHHVYGAAPGRSVSHALLRILDAANELENRIFVAQDLSKFLTQFR